jgi:hypothetical protein
MNIVLISPIAWDNSGGAHRPVQFAQALAQRGHAVTYIEIEKSRVPVGGTNPRVLDLEQLGWDELNLLRAWYGFDYVPPPDAVNRLLALLPASSKRGIVLCSAPFRPALELARALATRGYALVYDVLDDISEMRALGTFCYDDLAENYLATNADLIIALSPRLREKFRGHAKVVLIRDGVELEAFRTSLKSASAPITRGERTLGFWGTMWEYNLDVPLLQTLTRARPQWEWHFIGAYDLDTSRPSLAKALAAPNVHFHSSVARERLAQMANFPIHLPIRLSAYSTFVPSNTRLARRGQSAPVPRAPHSLKIRPHRATNTHAACPPIVPASSPPPACSTPNIHTPSAGHAPD